jgi:type VI secretion system protein ImpF
MARADLDNLVTIPLLDRLIDRDPRNSQEALMSRAQSVRLLKESLRRDLEWLLNTRRIKEESTDPKAELTHSLYNYGLPDLTHFSFHSARDMNRVTWLLENTVAVFEPRLRDAKVYIEPSERGTLKIKFRVEGILIMDPAPERVSFDTTLDVTSQNYTVEGS